MNTNDESTPTNPIPEQLPQTIPELFTLLNARLEVHFTELKNLLTVEVRRLEEDARTRYVDLRQRVELVNEKLDVYTEEVKFLRRDVRRLESKTDPSLPA
ncbi:MAG TPA: hypothetical protein VFD58_24205 [Blastocatellia bacterium]|nr:hypothetical protein [Blastocatellia bacterium]